MFCRHLGIPFNKTTAPFVFLENTHTHSLSRDISAFWQDGRRHQKGLGHGHTQTQPHCEDEHMGTCFDRTLLIAFPWALMGIHGRSWARSLFGCSVAYARTNERESYQWHCDTNHGVGGFLMGKPFLLVFWCSDLSHVLMIECALLPRWLCEESHTFTESRE